MDRRSAIWVSSNSIISLILIIGITIFFNKMSCIYSFNFIYMHYSFLKLFVHFQFITTGNVITSSFILKINL